MTCCGSLNHVWFKTMLLGHGATGNVYLGRHKKTGEKRAVKCFNSDSKSRPQETQLREFEVMKKIDHENVVRLLAIENESQSQQPVIIMELCSGGSLYDIIEQPQNGYGMEETEFRTMFVDVTAGMKYLHDNNIMHRDIKPGNILMAISSNGRSKYKLTDFGAAKITATPASSQASTSGASSTSNDAEFMSLYGTEEYLYPDMYARAVLRSAGGVTAGPFTAKVDLWSLGVTFFHAATGTLPFRPHGGRRNRVVMYDITKKKPRGAISGIQESENGEIVYRKELPTTCRLSPWMRKAVTSILARLLETESSRLWSFPALFAEVQKIREAKPVTVFDSQAGEVTRIYLGAGDRINNLKVALTEQTHIAPNDQLLFYGPVTLEKALRSTSDPIEQYPVTTDTNPIFVVGNSESQKPDQLKCDVPSTPKPDEPGNIATDATLAKKVAALSCYFDRRINEAIANQFTLIQLFLMVWQAMVVTPCERVHARAETFRESWHQHKTHIDASLRDARQRLLKTDSRPGMSRLQGCIEALQGKAERLREVVAQLETANLLAAVQSNAHLTPHAACEEEDNCVRQANILNQQILDTLAQFKKDKAQKTLNYNEEQIHKYERQRLVYTVTKMRSLYENHCFTNLKGVHRTFHDKLRQGWGYESEIRKIDENLTEATRLLGEVEDAHFKLLLAMPANIGTISSQVPTSPAPSSQEPDEGFGTMAQTLYQEAKSSSGQLMPHPEGAHRILCPVVQETSAASTDETPSPVGAPGGAVGGARRSGEGLGGAGVFGDGAAGVDRSASGSHLDFERRDQDQTLAKGVYDDDVGTAPEGGFEGRNVGDIGMRQLWLGAGKLGQGGFGPVDYSVEGRDISQRNHAPHPRYIARTTSNDQAASNSSSHYKTSALGASPTHTTTRLGEMPPSHPTMHQGNTHELGSGSSGSSYPGQRSARTSGPEQSLYRASQPDNSTTSHSSGSTVVQRETAYCGPPATIQEPDSSYQIRDDIYTGSSGRISAGGSASDIADQSMYSNQSRVSDQNRNSANLLQEYQENLPTASQTMPASSRVIRMAQDLPSASSHTFPKEAASGPTSPRRGRDVGAPAASQSAPLRQQLLQQQHQQQQPVPVYPQARRPSASSVISSNSDETHDSRQQHRDSSPAPSHSYSSTRPYINGHSASSVYADQSTVSSATRPQGTGQITESSYLSSSAPIPPQSPRPSYHTQFSSSWHNPSQQNGSSSSANRSQQEEQFVLPEHLRINKKVLDLLKFTSDVRSEAESEMNM